MFEIAEDEKDWDKRDKLLALQLADDEWERIDLFLRVLQVLFVYLRVSPKLTVLKSAQDAQHAFSADFRSTLPLTIPALEKLHAEWTANATQDKYSVFHDALNEALLKVDEYYQKTSNSNSYMFAMGALSLLPHFRHLNLC